MLKFCEERILGKDKYNIIVTLKRRFKRETGEKYHMLPLVDTTYPSIEGKRCGGRGLELLFE